MAGFIAAMPRRNLSAYSNFRAASARSEESRLLLWAPSRRSPHLIRTSGLPLAAPLLPCPGLDCAEEFRSDCWVLDRREGGDEAEQLGCGDVVNSSGHGRSPFGFVEIG